MSIRTNPMKAVPTLLKRLVTVEKHVNLNDLKSELTKIKDLFSKVKKNEEELLDTLADVKIAFLNGDLSEIIYVQQPEGFSISSNKDLVCKLKRSIFGLKQAFRQWYLKFDEVVNSRC